MAGLPIPKTVIIKTSKPLDVGLYPLNNPILTAADLQKSESPTAATAIDATSLVSSWSTKNEVVVLVDPVSTGVLLQSRLFHNGYGIILVWSDRTVPATHAKHYNRTERTPDDFCAVIRHHDDLDATLDQIVRAAGSSPIKAVVCGSEFGVLLEDAVADGLNKRLGTNNLKSSGMACTQTKVDKHAQATLLRQEGLNAVQETLAYSEEDVLDFLKQQGRDSELAVVVKPQTGAGSVGVTFCTSKQEVVDAFHAILAGEHKANYHGRYKHYTKAGVLVQEYLDGTEYIVNMVVLDGVIKTTAMFKYDKRPYNGAAFVCFSKELVVLEGETRHLEILEYAERVVRALGFKNGALHAEVMYTNRGPVLVEMNCRLHGGNAAWVVPAEICMGYSQLNVFMDAYLNEGKCDFSSVPSRPEKAFQWCHQVKMRTRVEGTLQGYIPEQMERIKNLHSYYNHFFSVRPGEALAKTVDMPTVPGEVTLIHNDKEQLARDYQKLNDILHEGIFQV